MYTTLCISSNPVYYNVCFQIYHLKVIQSIFFSPFTFYWLYNLSLIHWRNFLSIWSLVSLSENQFHIIDPLYYFFTIYWVYFIILCIITSFYFIWVCSASLLYFVGCLTQCSNNHYFFISCVYTCESINFTLCISL